MVLPDLKAASAMLDVDVFECVAEGDHVGRAMVGDGVGDCARLDCRSLREVRVLVDRLDGGVEDGGVG